MGEKKKTGFFGKLLGGNKKGDCCAVEFEEVPEPGSNQKEETSEKDSGEKEKKCCGCGC